MSDNKLYFKFLKAYFIICEDRIQELPVANINISNANEEKPLITLFFRKNGGLMQRSIDDCYTTAEEASKAILEDYYNSQLA